jgi:hypothetical protein
MHVSRVISLFVLLGCVSVADETTSGPAQPPMPPLPVPISPKPLPVPADAAPWLGLQVAKPDEAIRAQLPSLPAGIGFIIRTVDAGGAAANCGLQPFDVLWKLEDQWLVNEGQFATLLRLHKPGDSIALSVFRNGKPMEVKAILGAQPSSRALLAEPAIEAAVSPVEGNLLTRIINRETRTANLRMDDGHAVLKRLENGAGYELEIRGEANQVIFNGKLPSNGDLAQVPEAWQRRVGALKRGLDSALDGEIVPIRKPRPRIIPPAPNP